MKKNVEKEFSKIINDKKDGDISRNYEVIDQTLGNIKFQSDTEKLQSADYGVYPINFKHNWDYRSIISIPLLNDMECNSIISEWKDDDVIGEDYNVEGFGLKFEYRKCDINWVYPYQRGWEWLFDKVNNTIEDINKKVFKFELSSPIVQESSQFTKYESGGKYEEHLDWDGGTILDTRKLSYSINLSDPNTYTGGELVVEHKWAPVHRGWIHIFPSFLSHQAMPVVNGIRYVFIGWVAGPPFK